MIEKVVLWFRGFRYVWNTIEMLLSMSRELLEKQTMELELMEKILIELQKRNDSGIEE